MTSPLFGDSPVSVGCPKCGAAYGWACEAEVGVRRTTVDTHQERIDAYEHTRVGTQPARFVQIAANSMDQDTGELFALDASGDVWIYDETKGIWSWRRLSGSREP